MQVTVDRRDQQSGLGAETSPGLERDERPFAADPELLFGDNVDQKYEKALRKIGIDPGMLSSDAGHA